MASIGIYEKEYEIGINDIDKNNRMKLSTYLKLMQEVGALHSKEFGYGINDEPVTHRAWIIIAWKVEILSRPCWNEKIRVKSWIDSMDKIYYYRDFEIFDSRNNVIARAVSQWVMVDTVNKKIQKIEGKYLDDFVQTKREDYDNSIKRINSKVLTNQMKKIYSCKVQKRDIDTNNHMNNVIYLDLALEGISDEEYENITEIEIHYKSECKYNDNIIVMRDEKNTIYILDENVEKLHTVVMLK